MHKRTLVLSLLAAVFLLSSCEDEYKKQQEKDKARVSDIQNQQKLESYDLSTTVLVGYWIPSAQAAELRSLGKLQESCVGIKANGATRVLKIDKKGGVSFLAPQAQNPGMEAVAESKVGQLNKSGQLKLTDDYSKLVNETELKVTLVNSSLDNIVGPTTALTKLTLVISSAEDSRIKLELKAIAESEVAAYFEAQAACLN